jgi:hypothetical protein
MEPQKDAGETPDKITEDKALTNTQQEPLATDNSKGAGFAGSGQPSEGAKDPARQTPEAETPEQQQDENSDPPASSEDQGDAEPADSVEPDESPHETDGETPPQTDTPQEPSLDPMPVSYTEMSPNPLPVSERKHRKKWLVLGLIVVAVLLILGGGAAATYYYIANKPENVLKQALANSFDRDKNKTIEYSGAVTFEDGSSGVKLEGTYEGAIDSQTGALSLGGQMDALITNVTFDVRSTDGKTLYLKVGGLNGLAQLLASGGVDEADPVAAAYVPLIESLNNQWIEINSSMLGQVGGGTADTLTLSEEDERKLAEAYEANQFLTVKEALPDEEIGGTNSHHYKLAIDKAKLKSFAKAVKDAGVDSFKVTQEQLDSFNKSVDNENFDNYDLEIWIAKGSKMTKKLALATTDEEGSSVRLSFTIDSYNQPVEVQKPEGAKSLLEVVGDFFGGGLDLSSELPLETQTGLSL